MSFPLDKVEKINPKMYNYIKYEIERAGWKPKPLQELLAEALKAKENANEN